MLALVPRALSPQKPAARRRAPLQQRLLVERDLRVLELEHQLQDLGVLRLGRRPSASPSRNSLPISGTEEACQRLHRLQGASPVRKRRWSTPPRTVRLRGRQPPQNPLSVQNRRTTEDLAPSLPHSRAGNKSHARVEMDRELAARSNPDDLRTLQAACRAPSWGHWFEPSTAHSESPGNGLALRPCAAGTARHGSPSGPRAARRPRRVLPTSCQGLDGAPSGAGAKLWPQCLQTVAASCTDAAQSGQVFRGPSNCWSMFFDMSIVCFP